MRDIDNSQDVISFDDITERFAELRDEQDSLVEEYREAAEENEGEDSPSERLADAINALSTFWDITPEEVPDSVEALDNDADEFNGDEELATLRKLIDETRGYGGDHQFEGDWYPGSLIRDSYFETYAEELAEDVGAISRDAQWPLGCIDWEKAARELQVDYSTVEYDGVTYWYR